MKERKRICKCCGKKRRTTNVDVFYVCEPCLRTTGKALVLLNLMAPRMYKLFNWRFAVWKQKNQ